MLERQRAEFEFVARWLPAKVYFVLVMNEVEGALPHTRANAIIMPARVSKTSSASVSCT